MRTLQATSIFYAVALMLFMNNAVAAQDLSEIQNRFNAETINKRFNVPTDAALTSALKEAFFASFSAFFCCFCMSR